MTSAKSHLHTFTFSINQCFNILHGIKPTMVYGCETPVLNKKYQQKVEIQEQRILKLILGKKSIVEGWVIIITGMYEIYKEITEIDENMQTAVGLGDPRIMEYSRTVKKIAWKKFEVRKRGKRERTEWRKKAKNRK